MVSRKEFGVTSTGTHSNHNFPLLFLLLPSKTFLGRNHDRDRPRRRFRESGKKGREGKEKVDGLGNGGPSLPHPANVPGQSWDGDLGEKRVLWCYPGQLVFLL